MSASTVISELESLTNDIQRLSHQMDKVLLTNDEYNKANALTAQLSGASTAIASVLKANRDDFTNQRNRLKTQAEQTARDVIIDGEAKNRAMFKRNILQIFHGPQDSSLDSSAYKARKASTRRRSERLRSLSLTSLVLWALTFTPTSWSGGSWSEYLFECVLQDIEVVVIESWPESIHTLLHSLGTESPLEESLKYRSFLKGNVFV